MARDLTTAEMAGLDPHTRGVLDGLAMYAWWKDGTVYVGTTGTTLRAACAKYLHEKGAHALAEALTSP